MDKGAFVSRAEAESTTLTELLERYLAEITPLKKGAEPETSRLRLMMRHPLARRFVAGVRGIDSDTKNGEPRTVPLSTTAVPYWAAFPVPCTAMSFTLGDQHDMFAFGYDQACQLNRVEYIADSGNCTCSKVAAVHDGRVHFHFAVLVQYRTAACVEYRIVLQQRCAGFNGL